MLPKGSARSPGEYTPHEIIGKERARLCRAHKNFRSPRRNIGAAGRSTTRMNRALKQNRSVPVIMTA
jgi:hypothetical protein